jgi:hypothetical protein
LQYAHTFYERMEEDTNVKQALEFATFLQEIIWSGDDERALCRTMLQSMGLYLRSRLTPLHEWTA